MIIESFTISGLKKIKRPIFKDNRGLFSRIFCAETLVEAGFKKPISHINHSVTKEKGSIRGLHAQFPPHAEMKFITCLSGEIFDVAVDLRKNSPTYLQWQGVVLSDQNLHSFLIPEGFAHGFQALTDHTTILYCHSHAYMPSSEIGLNPQDPTLAISWPLPVTTLSEKDKNSSFIDSNFLGIDV